MEQLQLQLDDEQLQPQTLDIWTIFMSIVTRTIYKSSCSSSLPSLQRTEMYVVYKRSISRSLNGRHVATRDKDKGGDQRDDSTNENMGSKRRERDGVPPFVTYIPCWRNVDDSENDLLFSSFSLSVGNMMNFSGLLRVLKMVYSVSNLPYG